jgi:outer membrane protein assembly factor BamB
MRNRSVISSVLLCALLAASGCTVVLPGMETPGGPQFREAGPDRTPEQRRKDFPIDHGDYARIGYRLDWVGYPSITGSLPVRSIEPYDDVVAVVEQGGRLTVLETNTGGRRCGDQLGTPLTRFMGIERDRTRLVIATQAEVFSLNPITCNLEARFRNERIISTAPAVYHNLVIFGTGAGEIIAHALGGSIEGVKAWGFATGAAIEGHPVLMRDIVGAVSQNGEVTFVTAQQGRLVGRARIWGGLATNPVADDYTMYVASLDQSIYAIVADGGVVMWRYRTPYPLSTQPSLRITDEGTVLYAAVPGQGLVALDGGTGNVQWTARDFSGTVVAINRGRLVGFDGESAALLDPATGDILDRVPVPGAMIMKPDRFEDGNLYVVSRSGVVAKFNPR